MSNEPILSVRHLVKRFGGLTAVDDVSLDIHPGEVVGPGGRQRRRQVDAHQVRLGRPSPRQRTHLLRGQRDRISRDPSRRAEAGIETIYQDLALAGNLDVSANIFLGREVKKRYLGGVIKTLDEKEMLAESSGHPRQPWHPDPADAQGDREALRWTAPGGGHRPGHLLECPDDDHGRAHQQPRGARAAQGHAVDRHAQVPGCAGHLHLAHVA